ncbi:hypothetical protein GQ457_04G036540 [Hibiscus cannabinus]
MQNAIKKKIPPYLKDEFSDVSGTIAAAAACMVQPERVSGMRCCSKMGSQRIVFVAVTCSKISHSRGRCYGGVSADQTGFGTCFSGDVRSQSFR